LTDKTERPSSDASSREEYRDEKVQSWMGNGFEVKSEEKRDYPHPGGGMEGLVGR
jgi:hypothetical protein